MNLLKIALKEYENWKKTDAFSEEYKYDILEELNNFFKETVIDSSSVYTIAKKLNDMNRSEGELEDWSNLNDLVNYAEKEKELLADELNYLLKSNDPMNERIKHFRDKAAEVSKDYTFGTPFFGYIFAAYDRNKYTPFKDGDFSNYCQLLFINKETKVSKKYPQQLKLVNELNEYDEIESLLDAQSFLHVLNQEQFKFKVLIKYLLKMSTKLNQLMNDKESFFGYVNQLDKNELAAIAKQYKNSEKINGIRYEFSNQLLKKTDASVEDVENIYNESVDKIVSQYDTDIMRSWEFSKILFPFFYNKYKKYARKYLTDLSEIIIKNLETDGTEIESSENDFLWNQNFGTTTAWIALYPKKFDSHKEAVQLHLGITPSGLVVGLMSGSNNTLEIRDTEIFENIDFIALEKIINKFNNQLQEFYDLNNMINYYLIGINIDIEDIEESLSEEIYLPTKEENYNVLKKDDKIVVYEASVKKKIIGTGTVVNSYHQENDENGITIKFSEIIDGITLEKLKSNGIIDNSDFLESLNEDKLFELNSKEYYELMDYLDPINKPSDVEELNVNFNDNFTFKDKSLVFEKGILEALESQISIVLRNQKNIILVGPPGTGKSKLAKEICNHYRKSEYNLITANSDWSTFDTIGGYKPQKDGSLKFQPGLFLKQFKNNEMNINRWLIIDEINRADIDKAFGAFFSALAGDQVNLSFEDENGKNIVITNNEADDKNHHYLIHKDWRLIATMNTLDKTSLYEMSYAFMRRFAFISVPSPRNISNELIHRYLSVWEITNKDYVEDIKKVWQLINNYRKIGPALIEDFYKYLVASQGDYASAINMFVIPQLEGVYDDKIIELSKRLREFDFINDKIMLKDFINNFFMLEE